VVRPARVEDAAVLGRLGALLVRMHHELDTRRFIPATARTEHGYAAWLQSQLAVPDVVVLVAEREAEVVGYAYGAIEGHDWMTLRGPAGVLHDLVVDPAHRGHGIGSLLLDGMLVALRSLGAPRAVLSTAARNADAQRLFARAGFRPTMVEMTRELADEEA
jgi:ribosomal protein S18 acetylase RimI-like enzyme